MYPSLSFHVKLSITFRSWHSDDSSWTKKKKKIISLFEITLKTKTCSRSLNLQLCLQYYGIKQPSYPTLPAGTNLACDIVTFSPQVDAIVRGWGLKRPGCPLLLRKGWCLQSYLKAHPHHAHPMALLTLPSVPLPPTYKFAQDCGAAKYWITVKKGAILKGKGNPI